ncbi:hypothetical protein [Glutamicibacter ardleyensis]|uniref:Uncharacterized protein n=1 Tax=Glutamicibacter ardleyensis TaxID=225894 RepID=A0ABQ2DKZ0_9MICC|nr:hypothetical protein [Glutamicibacter ardleyensis]GGJ59168.1 hypothetical protein GCM10007173_17420 [Glutamicibacter ardleyensis]
MPKNNPKPDFLTELARYNAINAVQATFSEMKKTARRLERAFNDRADKAVEAAEFLALAYEKEYSDITGETAVAHAMNPKECDHHKSVERRLMAA